MGWNENLDTNSKAYAFATAEDKTIRVVAGPGVGKSFSLQRRIAKLLEDGVNPEKILAVTFTRTAAQDLKNEIMKTGVSGAEKVTASTLHSLCFKILQSRSIIEETGRNPRPLMKYELKPLFNDLSASFGGMREKEKLLEAFESMWARLQTEELGFAFSETDRQFDKEIKQWLKEHKAMLFGEMIIETYKYLKNNPYCPERNKYKYILVDEYQDLNKAEQCVIDELAQNNLVVIGDDDQSIYSFKYANPDGIRNFPSTHDGCLDIKFEQCRRCPKKVVSIASSLISHNSGRTLGDLFPFESNNNGEIQIVQWKNSDEEIEGIARNVVGELNKGEIKASDILILCPSKIIGNKVCESIRAKGISAKSLFDVDLLCNDSLKRNFSLLAYLTNENDYAALRYLLGSGSNNYLAGSYKPILEYSRNRSLTIQETLLQLSEGKITIPRTNNIIIKFKDLVEEKKSIFEKLQNDRDYLVTVLTEQSECEEYKALINDAIANVGEEADLVKWLEKVYHYLVEAISKPNISNLGEMVRVMSLHASKGLSAKYVIVMSAVNGLIPRIDTKNKELSVDQQLEEQRRLFYVAITRCKCDKDYPGKLVISSFAHMDRIEALRMGIKNNNGLTHSSQFVSELGPDAPNTQTGQF